MEILNEIWNVLTGLFGTIRNPNDEINDIVGDFDKITNRLAKVQAKHDKADKEALAEINVVKTEMERKLAALDAQHTALIAAQQRAAIISKKLTDLIS